MRVVPRVRAWPWLQAGYVDVRNDVEYGEIWRVFGSKSQMKRFFEVLLVAWPLRLMRFAVDAVGGFFSMCVMHTPCVMGSGCVRDVTVIIRHGGAECCLPVCLCIRRVGYVLFLFVLVSFYCDWLW